MYWMGVGADAGMRLLGDAATGVGARMRVQLLKKGCRYSYWSGCGDWRGCGMWGCGEASAATGVGAGMQLLAQMQGAGIGAEERMQVHGDWSRIGDAWMQPVEVSLIINATSGGFSNNGCSDAGSRASNVTKIRL